MDFRLSQEQELLRDSARRYFAADARTIKTDDWVHYADSGWLAMPVPEDAGGLAAKLEDIAILSEEMGRGLARAPFLGSALLPARILERCGNTAQRQALLSDIVENSVRMAVAIYEPDQRYGLLPGARALPMPDGSFQISGSKTIVAGGAQADRLIVSASIERPSRATEPALFVIDTDRAGVERRSYETIDDVRVADFAFEDVAVAADELLVSGELAVTILEDAVDEATICLCAEMLGCMDQAIRLTADFLKLRKQFGRPLAEFQALQHTVAEMCIDANSARSMVYRAIAAAEDPPASRRRAVSACSIKTMQAAKSVTAAAVHLHGGIGFTCEYPVGHYLRRVVVAERCFGDREHHLVRYLA